ncbi:methyl-accepting chemotaxis protein [Domibacillus robiginosus]|uniref:methyl-accepting chemotaxis protein n=1 Tax=Domibacillus robiginosus TaxID=1071054 RepID=UPI00067C40FF|nr:methyl-accepting chemotaxis protein [Domibacillus robiginosus]
MNLLALNTAIEVAHVEKQGKGFAVAVDEMRRWAEQPQSSTKLIAELVNHIQKDMEIEQLDNFKLKKSNSLLR